MRVLKREPLVSVVAPDDIVADFQEVADKKRNRSSKKGPQGKHTISIKEMASCETAYAVRKVFKEAEDKAQHGAVRILFKDGKPVDMIIPVE